MFSFLRNIRGDAKSGVRAGQLVTIVQKIVGRPLSGGETRTVRKFHDEMNFSESATYEEIALDYIFFILNDDRNFPWEKPKLLGRYDKEVVIENVQNSIKRGTLLNIDEDHIALMREVAGLD